MGGERRVGRGGLFVHKKLDDVKVALCNILRDIRCVIIMLPSPKFIQIYGRKKVMKLGNCSCNFLFWISLITLYISSSLKGVVISLSYI